jgi:hypothetical protein
MVMESNASSRFSAYSTLPLRRQRKHSVLESRRSLGTQMKALQSTKIRELGDALITAGFFTLDEQAKVLGLSRSTTWTILKGNHKASGLTTSIINRMLAAPQLPALARLRILEYVEEKAAGSYGGSRAQRSRFVARLSPNAATDCVFDECPRRRSARRKKT